MDMKRARCAPAIVMTTCLLISGCSSGQQDYDPAAYADGESAAGWPTYGGQSSGTQYSSLDQVNRGNVDQLEVAWTYHAGDLSTGTEDSDSTAYQVTPTINNNKLYLCTPFNHVVALDPGTGEELWRFDPERPLKGAFYGGNYCRGVAYWESDDAAESEQFCGKRVLEGAQNGVLHAVDADTGERCTDFGQQGNVDLNTLDYKGEGQVFSTSPPAIYGDVAIIGGASYDNVAMDSVDGIVRAFDIRTGREIWNWNPIPEQLSDKTGGANTWAPISIDTERGWVFLPTTSPSIDKVGIFRTEPIPHANAVVVLDALTGAEVWSYQTVHHDLWDYDLASMPTLVNVERNGRSVAGVLQATKMGFVFLLDRDTGEPLFPVIETPVPQTDIPGEYTSPTQPIPKLPAPVTVTEMEADDAWGMAFFDTKSCHDRLEGLRNEGVFTPPSLQGSILYPSFIGGTNWGGVAYDEATGLAVMNATNLVTFLKLIPRDEYDPDEHTGDGNRHNDPEGSPYILERGMLSSPLGFGPKKPPCNPPPWGLLTAVDLNTGETRWKIPFGKINVLGPFESREAWGSPNQGGPIITRGGLVFIGASPDNRLRAYDLQTGDQVWAGEIPAPAIATPMTYEYEGRQFVVVAAGGRQDFQTDISDAIVAFALPETD